MIGMADAHLYTNICSSAVRNRLGLVCRPSFCTYLVTWRCNARCQMCEIWKKRADDRDEMGLDDIRKAFTHIGRLDAVRLSGGEPFLRDDFLEITNGILEISQPGMIHITSNGLLTDRIVDFMKAVEQPGKIHLKISLDSLGDNHSAIRGVPKAFEHAMDTLGQLADLRRERGFILGVNQTIMDPRGVEDAKALRSICDCLGIGLYQTIAFDNDVSLYSKGECKPNTYERIKQNFSGEELRSLFEDMEATNIDDFRERLSKRYYLKGMRNRIIRGSNRPNPPCAALGSHLRLLPNGDIPVCLLYNVIVGNAMKDNIGELWAGEKMEKHREIVRRCEGCWVGCETIPSAIYSGDIMKGILP